MDTPFSFQGKPVATGGQGRQRRQRRQGGRQGHGSVLGVGGRLFLQGVPGHVQGNQMARQMPCRQLVVAAPVGVAFLCTQVVQPCAAVVLHNKWVYQVEKNSISL